MMKKGFTLVERINEEKEESREKLISSIELATKQYVLNHENELSNLKQYDYDYISLETLEENNMFTSSLIDMTKKESLPISDTVYVLRSSNGEIITKYDINQNNKPKLTLIGSYNTYVKKGSNYSELGVTAISTNNEDVSSSVTISGTVNTSNVGKYIISYTLGEVIITRNVYVYE